jgi:prepilin-type N-terminal cleavage/methylation domain-containing protein
MRPTTKNTKRGFSLLELMVAMAIGLIVLGAATQLFKTAMDSTTLVTEQAEMQQNVRSALNMIARDVSMAGAGLPPGGLPLPYGGGAVSSHFGCDQAANCYLVSNKYPNGLVGGAPVPNYMFGLIPGPINGLESGGPAVIPATNATADSVTTIYVDYSFPLSQYKITFPDLTGTSVTATQPALPPLGFPAIISPGGIIKGDLILLSNSKGSAVGEVTDLTPVVNPTITTISFSDGDPLKINQAGAPNGNIAYIATTNVNVATVAYRVWAVTYFIEIPGNGQTPRLMRQVNSQAPIPVADNIIGLNVTYDTCTTVNPPAPCAGLRDPIGNVPSYSPNQVNKVNIQVMGQSVLSSTGKSVSMALATSVTARDIAFKSRY